MFGVNRWGGHGVQEITEAAAQARLEAWKRKAKAREEAKQKQAGLNSSNKGAVAKPAHHGAMNGSKRNPKVDSKPKDKRERKRRSNHLLDNQAQRAAEAKQQTESNGVRNSKTATEQSHRKGGKQVKRSANDETAKLVEGLSAVAKGAAAKKAPPASNGVHSDGKGSAKPKSKDKVTVADATDLAARRAAEIGRAERRELKRRKEVERAHEIIAKKAKKARKGGVATPVVPVADGADEDATLNVPVADKEDEEQAREERRRLKRLKRDERRRGTSDVIAEAGRDEPEMGEQRNTKAALVREEGLEEEPGVKRESDEGIQKAGGGSEAVEHRRRKRRKEGINAGASDQSVDLGVSNEVGGGRKQVESNIQEDTHLIELDSTVQDSEYLEGQPTVAGEDDFPGIKEAETADIKKPEAPTKGPPLLPWMRAPIEIGEDEGLELSSVPGLNGMLKSALEKARITGLFPVQAAVWREMVASGAEDHDLCVCAPTGSGKTFAYALPICQGLSQRVVRRLRALVVLPTRDLALQVKAVFDLLAPSIGLSVGLAVGQTSLAGEARHLVSLGRSFLGGFTPEGESALAESNVDILVCTPGRLMDHVHDTPGFTLQHLRYLVVDETDRLLRQAYQDWLPIVLAAASASGAKGHVATIRRPIPERGIRTPVPRVVKLILSATLTRDPAKIQQLQLHRPRYIATSATDHRYNVPQQLQEFRLVCTAGEKPLYLVALLRQLKGQPTIVFTASVEATHRLFTLLQAFEGLPVVVGEYSSLQPQRVRGAVLEAFRRGDVGVLVSSDAMTRGMDVEGVENVVSYDAPVYAKTYVHRAGRTARAGRSGRCFTLLRKEEVRHFKGLLRKVDNNFCPDYPLPPGATEELVPFYTAALEKLKETVAGESAGGGGTQR